MTLHTFSVFDMSFSGFLVSKLWKIIHPGAVAEMTTFIFSKSFIGSSHGPAPRFAQRTEEEAKVASSFHVSSSFLGTGLLVPFQHFLDDEHLRATPTH